MRSMWGARNVLELCVIAVSAAGGLHPGGAQAAVGEHANIGRTKPAAGDRIRQNHHVGHVDLRDS